MILDMNCGTLTCLAVFVELFNLAKAQCVKRHAMFISSISQLLPENVMHFPTVSVPLSVP
jgi:hypothetical protein